jgi:glycosyltransferase involved in cell wall biosynthesis
MKILQVIPSVGPLRGGPSQALRSIVAALTDAGVSVDVVTTDDNGPLRLSVACGIPTREHNATFRYFPCQTNFYTFSWPLTKWLARHTPDYDVVHIHALFSYPATISALFSRRCRVPYVIRPLGTLNRWGIRNRRPWLKQLSLRCVEAKVLRSAAFVHFTAEDERAQASDLGIPHRPIVIPNIAEAAQTAPFKHSRSGSSFEILFLSRIDPKKGLDLLLNAFQDIRRRIPYARLTIAGSGNPAFAKSLRTQATRLGLDSAICWREFVSGEEKQRLLSESDVFVLPSYSENFGIAAVEAMASGLPVVITDAVAIHKDVSRARAGLVVKCAAAEISAAVLDLYRRPSLGAELARNGRALVQEKFSSGAVAQSLISCYEMAIRNR